MARLIWMRRLSQKKSSQSGNALFSRRVAATDLLFVTIVLKLTAVGKN